MKIIVKGYGNWEYIYHKNAVEEEPEKHFHFQGLGMKMVFEPDERRKEEEIIWLLVLDDEVSKHFSIPDEPEYTYEPMFNLHMHRSNHNCVKWAWTTGYYDGPLSGYIRKDGRLYYCAMVEETTYSRERYFAVYKIGLLGAMNAYFWHSFWQVALNNKVIYKFWFWKYNMNNKVKKWLRGDKYYEVEAKKHHDWLDSLEVIGYFKY